MKKKYSMRYNPFKFMTNVFFNIADMIENYIIHKYAPADIVRGFNKIHKYRFFDYLEEWYADTKSQSRKVELFIKFITYHTENEIDNRETFNYLLSIKEVETLKLISQLIERKEMPRRLHATLKANIRFCISLFEYNSHDGHHALPHSGKTNILYSIENKVSLTNHENSTLNNQDDFLYQVKEGTTSPLPDVPPQAANIQTSTHYLTEALNKKNIYDELLSTSSSDDDDFFAKIKEIDLEPFLDEVDPWPAQQTHDRENKNNKYFSNNTSSFFPLYETVLNSMPPQKENELNQSPKHTHSSTS